MNSTEHDNIIQKAICCSGTKGKEVADMFLNGDACAEHELLKLDLLLSYTETLGCYRAPLEVTTYTYSGSTLTATTTTTEYENCLTEDQADFIASQISQLCDMCDTH